MIDYALLKRLRLIFQWQHDYTVELRNTGILVSDDRRGYFMTILTGSDTEVSWVVNAVKSWRKG